MTIDGSCAILNNSGMLIRCEISEYLTDGGVKVMKKPEEVFEGGGPRIIQDLSEAEGSVIPEGVCEVLELVKSCSEPTIRQLAQFCDAKECPICQYLDALSKSDT